MARIATVGLVGRSMFFEVPRFHAGGETITAQSVTVKYVMPSLPRR